MLCGLQYNINISNCDTNYRQITGSRGSRWLLERRLWPKSELRQGRENCWNSSQGSPFYSFTSTSSWTYLFKQIKDVSFLVKYLHYAFLIRYILVLGKIPRFTFPVWFQYNTSLQEQEENVEMGMSQCSSKTVVIPLMIITRFCVHIVLFEWLSVYALYAHVSLWVLDVGMF